MLQLGTDQQFSTLRSLLEKAHYFEPEICERFGIPSFEKFEEEFDRAQLDDVAKDATGVLIQLFIEGHYVDLDVAERFLGAEALQAMADLGLIERNPSKEDEIACTAALYPTAGVWIVSDRWNHPDRSSYKPREDVVYPAIVSNAQRFLRFLPRTECDSMLDLCSGTAFAALHGARYFAKHAWAFDIADRSTLFAEFNRRLNGLPNVTAVTGDLYEPAQGRQFDLIVAHPPYVPVLRPKWIYHDGGPDGEQIVRRCVEGIPQHLKPGGMFYLLAMASDREDASYEKRIRQWFGEAEGEFDVATFIVRSLDPEDFAVRAVVNSETPPSDIREFKRLFKSLGVTEMVYAALFIQRRAEARPVFTFRRQNTAMTRPSDMAAALRWETSMVSSQGFDTLMRAKIRANPEAELRVQHRLEEGGWEIKEYMLRTSKPFSMEARTDPWAPFLLAQCDGTKTVAEQFETMKTMEAIPADTEPEQFGRALAVLISGGLLLLEQ